MLFSHFRLELANCHVPAARQLSAGRSIAMRLPSGTNVNSISVHCNESLHYYRYASSVFMTNKRKQFAFVVSANTSAKLG